MKWRNCKEKEVHNARSPMDELMAQGLAQEEEEPARNRTDAKTKRSPTSQKSIKDTWKGLNGGAANDSLKSLWKLYRGCGAGLKCDD